MVLDVEISPVQISWWMQVDCADGIHRSSKKSDFRIGGPANTLEQASKQRVWLRAQIVKSATLLSHPKAVYLRHRISLARYCEGALRLA